MELIKQKWNDILLAVKNEFDIPDASYETFLKLLQPYSVEDNTLYILYPIDTDQVALNFIKKKYEVPLNYKISEIIGSSYNLEFILPKDVPELSVEEPSPIENNPNYRNSNLNSYYKFDTFVVGSNNRFAQATALTVAESPGEAYNPLYIYGGPGLGKTHLMHAIGNFILDRQPNMRVLYVTCEEFVNEVIDSILTPDNNNVAKSKLREKYRTVDVLLIDDIQFILGKAATQDEFFFTFNALRDAGKQIVISSDRPPKELETLEDRIKSRFEWGIMADIGLPDYETRMAILHKKQEEYNFYLNDEILNYIASNIKSNIRELEGALKKLKAYIKLENKDITVEIAQRELESIISPDKEKEITPQLIIEVVADHYQISMAQMISKARSSNVARPRQIAMYLCQEFTDSTKTYIGQLLGNRDHSTVINGINKITEEYNNNPDVKADIDLIKKKLSPI